MLNLLVHHVTRWLNQTEGRRKAHELGDENFKRSCQKASKQEIIS
jgi:hypothetical protein